MNNGTELYRIDILPLITPNLYIKWFMPPPSDSVEWRKYVMYRIYATFHTLIHMHIHNTIEYTNYPTNPKNIAVAARSGHEKRLLVYQK